MMVLLQAMQGLGKPGVSIWGTTMGAPSDTDVLVSGLRRSGRAHRHIPGGRLSARSTPRKQRLWRLTVPDAILNPPVSWYGEGFCGQSLEQQFKHFEYPMKGHSEVRLFYRYGGSFIGTMS